MTSKMVILDFDGLADSWEMEHFDTLDYDGMSDPDYDGLVNLVEQKEDTDPTKWDADENGYPLSMFYHSDEDGLSDFDELRYGTDPFVQDSDGDGVNDADEVTNGSDPADADDQGNPTNCLSVELVVGDHSASESERYELKVGLNVRHVAPQWGKLNTNTYAFVKGKEHPFEVHWLNTAPGKTTDYDYTSLIGGLSGSGSGDGFIVDDPEGILGVHGESTFDFAAGKTGTLYVIKVDIILTNEYPDIPISPIYDDTPGKKWVIATFPEPDQINVDWDVQLLGLNNADANVKYQRGTSAEATVGWEGTAGDLYFTNGWLNASVRLNDGSNTVPQMSLTSNILMISSVQQGDRIIIEETATSQRDEAAVVKNFSWNDLQRLGTNNLTIHSDFGGLTNAIKDAIIDTIIFCLDNTDGRAQKPQLTNDCFPDSGLSSVVYTNFQASHTNLLQLDIPSARSMGQYPDDYEHWHMGLEVASLPAIIVDKKNDLENAASQDADTFPEFQDNTATKLVDLLNTTYSETNVSFTLSHTYELGEGREAEYVDPAGQKVLKPGDPIRNIRYQFTTNATPKLSYPGQEDDANWKNATNEPPQEVWQVEMFINRKGEVILIGSKGGKVPWAMWSDALREE